MITDAVSRSNSILQNVTEALEIDTDVEASTTESKGDHAQTRSFQ